MKSPLKKLYSKIPSGIMCLGVVCALFIYLGHKMGTPNMLNTIMNTAHDLLLNTVFYLMAICVITGALGRILVDFGVVTLLEKLLRPLMKPLFNLPGVASLGAVMTFLSDNPAIISLAQDKKFSAYFKKYQFISLTNFGTAFGMGLLVIVFMLGQGFYAEPFIGLLGAVGGCIISTRLMQRFVIKAYPKYKEEDVCVSVEVEADDKCQEQKPLFQRILDALLDGGRTGVDVGLAIIPGVLIISTLVMLLTFGPSASGAYAGAALGLIPNFMTAGWINGNAIAVFTAIGMCWSGYLSTHTAMLDALGYRKLTSKAIIAHTVGGLVAAFIAHWAYVVYALIVL